MHNTNLEETLNWKGPQGTGHNTISLLWGRETRTGWVKCVDRWNILWCILTINGCWLCVYQKEYRWVPVNPNVDNRNPRIYNSKSYHTPISAMLIWMLPMNFAWYFVFGWTDVMSFGGKWSSDSSLIYTGSNTRRDARSQATGDTTRWSLSPIVHCSASGVCTEPLFQEGLSLRAHIASRGNSRPVWMGLQVLLSLCFTANLRTYPTTPSEGSDVLPDSSAKPKHKILQVGSFRQNKRSWQNLFFTWKISFKHFFLKSLVNFDEFSIALQPGQNERKQCGTAKRMFLGDNFTILTALWW